MSLTHFDSKNCFLAAEWNMTWLHTSWHDNIYDLGMVSGWLIHAVYLAKYLFAKEKTSSAKRDDGRNRCDTMFIMNHDTSDNINNLTINKYGKVQNYSDKESIYSLYMIYILLLKN